MEPPFFAPGLVAVNIIEDGILEVVERFKRDVVPHFGFSLGNWRHIKTVDTVRTYFFGQLLGCRMSSIDATIIQIPFPQSQADLRVMGNVYTDDCQLTYFDSWKDRWEIISSPERFPAWYVRNADEAHTRLENIRKQTYR